MRNFILTLFLLAAFPAQAANCNALDVKVNGLICDFCARAVEKVFGARDEVSGVTVDLEHGRIGVALKPGKTIDEATIQKLVTDSGYTLVGVDRACKAGGHG